MIKKMDGAQTNYRKSESTITTVESSGVCRGVEDDY